MNFNKLQTKILSGYIVIVILFSIIAGISYFQLKNIEKQVSQLTNVEFQFYQINQKLSFNLSERTSSFRGYMLYHNKQYVDDFMRLTQESVKRRNILSQKNHNKSG